MLKKPYLHPPTVKRTASILLLAILAFNWVGYRFVSSWLENNASRILEARVDNNDFDESSLIELRVPLNTPYLTNVVGSEFEPFSGEIEINGTHYQYVKRKIDNGELVLLCLPNETKTRFQNARVDFFKLVNDLNQSTQGKEKSQSSFKSFTTEYKEQNNSWAIIAATHAAIKHQASSTAFSSEGYSSLHGQPPRA